MPLTVSTARVATFGLGSHQATCTAVETRTSLKTGGEYRWWEFTRDDGATISGITSMSFHERSTGGKWLAGLMGRKVENGETVEPVGQRCTIMVEADEEWGEKIAGVFVATSPKPTSVRSAPVAASGAAVGDPPADVSEAATEDLPF